MLSLCQWWNIRKKEKNLEEKENTLISGISFFGHTGKVIAWPLVQHVRCFCVTTGTKMCPRHLEHTKKRIGPVSTWFDCFLLLTLKLQQSLSIWCIFLPMTHKDVFLPPKHFGHYSVIISMNIYSNPPFTSRLRTSKSFVLDSVKYRTGTQ